MTRPATQRAADRRDGYPVAAWMTEDPARAGIPLFLQTQNRRDPDPGKMAALREAWGRGREVDPDAGRRDFRKPLSMSWEAWDAIQARDEAEKRSASLARIAEMRAKKGLPPPGQSESRKPSGPPRIIGYKGHIQGSRKARVHECFDLEGPEAAVRLAAELGLKEGTAGSWVKAWGR